MVEAAENVLDAEREIRERGLRGSERRLHHERRASGRQALDLRGAVETFHAREHVRRAGGAADDLDRAADQTTRPLDAPALRVAVRGELPSTRLDVHRSHGETHVERQA